MQQTAQQDDELYFTDASAGDILRQTREHYGQSLADIEVHLRIRASQIHALEQNEHHKLPGRTYVIGFVRSYSEYLGLDPDQMVDLYKNQMTGGAPKPELHFPAVASDNQIPNKYIIAACSVLLIVGLMTWSIIATPNNTSPLETIPPVPVEVTAPEPVAENTTAPSESELPEATAEVIAAPPPPPAKTITLTLTQDSWVEIRDGKGQKLVSQVLKKGAIYNVNEKDDLKISIGNAGGISLTLSGEDIGPMGARGQVIRNFPISYESLKEKYSPDSADAVNQL